MAPELVKVGRLRIEVLSYANAREWIRKVTAYLKGEGFWSPIQDVIKDREGRPEATASAAEQAEKSILRHEKLTDDNEKKAQHATRQKSNYQAVSTLLSIISKSDQQAVENLEYAGDIWLYVTKKY